MSGVFLFTDFGLEGPYVGQMKAALLARAPRAPVVDLMHDAPAFRPREAGYLLAALLPHLPADAVVVAVVDPGVGGARAALCARAGTGWLVGPDNGLLAPALRSAPDAEMFRLSVPADASMSFHGRDVFAPAAASLAAAGVPPDGAAAVPDWVGRDWPATWSQVIYIDRYGNAMTGLPAAALPADAGPRLAGRVLERARTFDDVSPGTAFWYENSIGLAEIAANQCSAAAMFGLAVGDPVAFEGPAK